MRKYTTRELSKCCATEAGTRRKVYDRLVREGRMTQAAADRQIAMMGEASDVLAEMADAEESKGKLAL